MKKTTFYFWLIAVVIQSLLIGGYYLKQSWFINANPGSVVGIRDDYSIQLTRDGVLTDSKQLRENSVISTNISRYIFTTIKYVSEDNVLIMEEGHEDPPRYIIYDDFLKRFIFINKPFNYVDYWVGGYQSVGSIDELTDPMKERYERLIKNGQWIELKDM